MRTGFYQKVAITLLGFIAGLLTAVPVHAGVPVGAQLGPIWIGGNPTSGGSVFYQLNVTATSPGTLTARATVSAKGWRGKFPVLISTPALGASVIDSGTITVPANFQGDAILRISVLLNHRPVGAKTIKFSISPPSPSVAQAILYDVGFNTPVTLDASIVPTNGLGQPLTYTWSQFQGPPVALSATNTAMATFTTDALTNFVELTDALGVVPFNVLEIGEDNNGNLDTYGFQVVVSDGVNSAIGNVLVRVASLSPGLTQVPIGVKTYLQAAASETNHSWTLVTAPAGSAAVLNGAHTRTPWLQPDLEGQYIVSDTVAGTNLTLTAASFAGVSTCGSCHGPNPQVGLADLVTPWKATGHATMLQRGVDGVLDPSYNQGCFFCHSVGYNKQASQPNGSFGDIQANLGWTVPQPLQSGDFTTMPSSLQNKGNIQCESCHGPGSQHPGSPNLDAATCAPCHQENNSDNFRVGQWQSSPHFNTDNAAVYGHAGNNSCAAQCHSPQGFVDRTKGLTPVAGPIGKTTCSVCHDPHNAQEFPGGAHQVRVYDTVTLGDTTLASGTVQLTGQGSSAVCMSCHNGRALPMQVSNGQPVYMTGLPHESTATEVLAGVGGVNYGQTIRNSPHTQAAACTTCHMFQLSSVDDPNYNLVGSHTFSMVNTQDGTDNLAACNQCHKAPRPVGDFDFVAIGAGDYDGDGTVDGVQTETRGLLNVLSNKFAQVGVTVYNGYPFVNQATLSTNATQLAAQRKALWNYVLINNDRSFGVHNTQYTIHLLQTSYTDLSTNCVDLTTGKPGNPFRVDYPKAALR
jgi:hypothetical protein